MGFWNVVGLAGKDKEFWRSLRDWDVMVLSETWTDVKNWERIRRKLSIGYVWGTIGKEKE